MSKHAVHHLCLFVGLTPSERELLESLFALDRRGGGEQLARAQRPEEAHLIFVNGDDRGVVERLRAANPAALLVLVGQPAGESMAGLAVLRRPLKTNAVIEVLSQLDWPAPLPGAQGAAAPGDGSDSIATFVSGSSAFASTTASMPADPPILPRTPIPAAPHSVPAHLAGAHGTPAPGATVAAPLDRAAPGAGVAAGMNAVSAGATWRTAESTPPPAADAAALAHEADVLVVVGALGQRSHTLPRGLRRLGFRVALIEGPAQAQAALAQRVVPFVFLDQASLGDHLMPLARALTARRPVPGAAPHVVVLARHGSVFERLRVRAAGGVWMLAPLDRARLLAFFARRGLHPRAPAGAALT